MFATPTGLWRAAALALGTGVSSAAEGKDGKDGKDQPQHQGKPGKDLPSQAQLLAALKSVVTNGNNGGIGLNMWATLVNRAQSVTGTSTKLPWTI